MDVDEDLLFLARLRGLAMQYDQTFGDYPERQYEGWAFMDWVTGVLNGIVDPEDFKWYEPFPPEYWLKK